MLKGLQKDFDVVIYKKVEEKDRVSLFNSTVLFLFVLFLSSVIASFEYPRPSFASRIHFQGPCFSSDTFIIYILCCKSPILSFFLRHLFYQFIFLFISKDFYFFSLISHSIINSSLFYNLNSLNECC